MLNSNWFYLLFPSVQALSYALKEQKAKADLLAQVEASIKGFVTNTNPQVLSMFSTSSLWSDIRSQPDICMGLFLGLVMV